MAYRGKSLRALRESKNIRLRSVANETRISLTYLADLEDERFDRFPGAFYFQSFAKAYATVLDLSPEEVCQDLGEHYELWQAGEVEASEPPVSTPMEEGLWDRVSSFLRGAQEV